MAFTQINQDFYAGAAISQTHEDLPAGVYTLMYDPERGLFCRATSNFKLPAKIYGHNSKTALEILEHFEETPNRITGALLSGTKGTGKSLTAKEICIEAVKRGMPVIIVSEAFAGSMFNSFISSIAKSAIVFIDEFEKVYEDLDQRNKMLTFLDGVVTSHKLVLATINQSDNMEYLLNRPGRFYYHIQYGNITPDIINEYCSDFLLYPERKEEINLFVKSFKIFTIDMLTALIREVNKENQSLEIITKKINLKPDIHLRDCFFTLKTLVLNIKETTTNETQFVDLSHSRMHLAGYIVEEILEGNRNKLSCNCSGESLDLSNPFTRLLLLQYSTNASNRNSVIDAYLKDELSKENAEQLPKIFNSRTFEFDLDLSEVFQDKSNIIINRDKNLICLKTSNITFEIEFQKPFASLDSSSLFL